MFWFCIGHNFSFHNWKETKGSSFLLSHFPYLVTACFRNQKNSLTLKQFLIFPKTSLTDSGNSPKEKKQNPSKKFPRVHTYYIKNLHNFQTILFVISPSLPILRLMTCNNLKIQTNLPPILDRGEEEIREIRIGKWECLKYLLYPSVDGKYMRRFTIEEGAVFRGAGIALWANMVLEMSINIVWSGSEASLKLLGLAQSDTTIELDGIGKVSPGCENVNLRIDQTNILLGTWARVKGRPVLEVATDSIEWGHSCRIHRISGDALFYLQSHGIDAATSEGMLLEAEISRHIAVMEWTDEYLKAEILEKISK